MTSKKIVLVRDFSKTPYGRDEGDGIYSGKAFRQKCLEPAMRKYDHVHVDLTGYNRYGRSFLDEAFGGLIRESGFSAREVARKLTYSHDLVKSIEGLIDERIRAASDAR
jgi:hypothetical protein